MITCVPSLKIRRYCTKENPPLTHSLLGSCPTHQYQSRTVLLPHSSMQCFTTSAHRSANERASDAHGGGNLAKVTMGTAPTFSMAWMQAANRCQSDTGLVKR